jgi:hypothetical protein
MTLVVGPRGQQEAVTRAYPKPTYSRVIGLYAGADKGVGQSGWYITPPLGNRLWLLSGTVTWYATELDQKAGGFIWVRYSDHKPVNEDEVVVRWKPIVPNLGNIKNAFSAHGLFGQFSFLCMTLFDENQLRFGLVIQNGYADNYFYVQVLLEISEG